MFATRSRPGRQVIESRAERISDRLHRAGFHRVQSGPGSVAHVAEVGVFAVRVILLNNASWASIEYGAVTGTATAWRPWSVTIPPNHVEEVVRQAIDFVRVAASSH